MLFYGDRVRVEPTGQAMARLEHLLGSGLRRARRDWPVTKRLVLVFIAASQVLQGVADAEMMAVDQDDVTPAQRAGMALLLTLARAIASSWRGGVAGSQTASSTSGSAAGPRSAFPTRSRGKTAEGYAHYALYPEAAFEAAARCAWTAPPRVLGLRSIGTGLAAMVAVGAGARLQPLTLRPVGSPFARQLAAVRPSAIRDPVEPDAVRGGRRRTRPVWQFLRRGRRLPGGWRAYRATA
jgi:hypothetical protein